MSTASADRVRTGLRNALPRAAVAALVTTWSPNAAFAPAVVTVISPPAAFGLHASASVASVIEETHRPTGWRFVLPAHLGEEVVVVGPDGCIDTEPPDARRHHASSLPRGQYHDPARSRGNRRRCLHPQVLVAGPRVNRVVVDQRLGRHFHPAPVDRLPRSQPREDAGQHDPRQGWLFRLDRFALRWRRREVLELVHPRDDSARVPHRRGRAVATLHLHDQEIGQDALDEHRLALDHHELSDDDVGGTGQLDGPTVPVEWCPQRRVVQNFRHDSFSPFADAEWR